MNENSIASRIIIRYTYYNILRVYIFHFGCIMSWTHHEIVTVLPFKSEKKRYIRIIKKKNTHIPTCLVYLIQKYKNDSM
ncbi:Uncharacterized protein FWK35_00034666 [Aphis craccivora]|uniref:Uncharacterized protein n=1 Tax=Aphis craccivora TaxID=307492 RepID=A0A6G0ZDV5_APHCR|nr:Uncharacterized protein FWK35_00034666 [Aphis craccivora]